MAVRSNMFSAVLLCAVLTLVHAEPLSNCVDTWHFYQSKGWKSNDLPNQPISGGELRVCPRGLTCCTPEMEKTLEKAARSELASRVKGSLRSLFQTFKSRAQKFDDFVVSLLRKSKTELHRMFKRTYGENYEENAHVFETLFEDLEKYFTRGEKELDGIMSDLFQTLFLKMFQLMNGQYLLGQGYLRCIGPYTDYEPFKDIPSQLNLRVHRAFTATRTFSLSLHSVTAMLQNLLKLDLPKQCSAGLLRMSYCPACQGLPDLKPCSKLCTNVMKGCLAQHAELNSNWNAYLSALEVVGERLIGPFSIEAVVNPLNIKISEAIMNFQESGPVISKKVIQNCGQPRLKPRLTRAADPGKDDIYSVKGELELQTVKFDRQKYPSSISSPGSSMESIIRDVRNKVSVLRDLWNNLPYQMCNDEDYASPPSDDQCWNGQKLGSYEKSLVGTGLLNQAYNPEVKLNTTTPSRFFSEQIRSLQRVTTMLKQAYDGNDVKWPNRDPTAFTDDEDLLNKLSEQAGSGSGMEPEVVTEEDRWPERQPPTPPRRPEHRPPPPRRPEYRPEPPEPQVPIYDDDDEDERGMDESGSGDDEYYPDNDHDYYPEVVYKDDKDNTPSSAPPESRPHGIDYSLLDLMYKYVLPCVMVWFGQIVEGHVANV